MPNELQILSSKPEETQAASAQREEPQPLPSAAPQEIPAAEPVAEATVPEATVPDTPALEAEPATIAPLPAGATQIHGLGRRKTSVARVFLRPGNGRWKINGRTIEDYFPRPVLRQSVVQPLTITEMQGRFDVLVNVRGGGLRGQADAVRLGIARALVKYDETLRSRLRAEALLTRDPREVERKKPGRPKARKRFQFSKR